MNKFMKQISDPKKQENDSETSLSLLNALEWKFSARDFKLLVEKVPILKIIG